MTKMKDNILVCGLVLSGSSALIDLLREYDNFNVIPKEFDHFRAPGLVADQLTNQYNYDFPNKIEKLTSYKKKIKLFYNIFPVFHQVNHSNSSISKRYRSSLNQMKQLNLLKRLNEELVSNSSFEVKIKYVTKWIQDIGDIYNTKNFVVFNQPIHLVTNTKIWTKVFLPWKLIIVYRDPKDQLTDIIKKKYLYAPYGAPYMSHGGSALESIYGRSRESAINIHIDAIKNRYKWIDSLKKELDPDRFLMIDFEGLITNYDSYKIAIENFIGTKLNHKNPKLYFDPMKAKKNIDIFNEYLNDSEIESLFELEKWYKNMIKNNHILS